MLTRGQLDESPSFAPNGSMIIYATEDQGMGVLAAVSTDGRIHQRLVSQVGDVREPSLGGTPTQFDPKLTHPGNWMRAMSMRSSN